MEERRRSDHEGAVLRAWGDVIRRYRLWKQLSRRELSHAAGLSPVFLGEIERGEKDASLHTLCLISGALSAPLSELYLRVASRIWDGHPLEPGGNEQTSLPLAAREGAGAYLDPVSPARDETAFELYRTVRHLRTEQQIALLLLARSLETGQLEKLAEST